MGQENIPRETAAEVAMKAQEKTQDSLQEGKIQATEEMIRDRKKEFSTLHSSVDMKQRLAKLRDSDIKNDKEAFVNHSAIQYISEGENKGMYKIKMRDSSGNEFSTHAYLNSDNNTFVKTADGTSATTPKYIFGINENNRLVALTKIPKSDILLFIENGQLYKKEKKGKNILITGNTPITDSFGGKYTFKINNKQIQYTVLKQPSINTNYHSVSNSATPQSQPTQQPQQPQEIQEIQETTNNTNDTSPIIKPNNTSSISENSETTNPLDKITAETLKNLDKNKIQKLLNSIKTKNANKNSDIAKMLNFKLTENNKDQFQKTIQKIVGAPQNGYIGKQTLTKLVAFIGKTEGTSENTEVLSENLEKITKGALKSHQYEIENMLRTKMKSGEITKKLAEILGFNLTTKNKAKFIERVQQLAYNKTQKTKKGTVIDGVLGSGTLKKIWERKLNETLDGDAENIRQEILTAVKSFNENKTGDKEKFIKQLHYTARVVEENSQEAKNVLKYAKENAGTQRIQFVLKSLNNGGNSLILDSRTQNLYLVKKNENNELKITLAVKTAVGKNGFVGIGDRGVSDLAQLKELMNKKNINKTPKGFHTFSENTVRGFKRKGLDFIVDLEQKDKSKNGQYKGKEFMESITTPRNKKPSMITGALQIMGQIFLHGTDAWKNRITPTGKKASNGCVNVNPADMALLMNNDLKSILIV